MSAQAHPLHLLALHYFNVRQASFSQRLVGVGPTLLPTFLVRIVRQLPAFGVGGVMNTTLTQRGRDWAREQYCTRAAQSSENV